MEQQFTDIFTVPGLPQLIFDQYYSLNSLYNLGQKQNGEYTFVRKTDAMGNYLFDEIMGDNLEEELGAFFKKITQKLAKNFIDVEVIKKDDNTISIQYRPYILGEMNDWIDALLLYNLANYGEVLQPDEKGNDTTMPFSRFIHYTPSVFGKAFYRPLRKITLRLYGNRKQTQNKQQAIKQRQQIRSNGQTYNNPISVQNQNAQISSGKQMQKNQTNINAEEGNQTQKNNGTNKDLLLQVQQSLKNTQSNNLTQVQGTNEPQTDDDTNMPQQEAFQLQNNPVVVQKPKQYQSVSATRTKQQQKQQQQLQKDKEQTIKEIMIFLIQKINYYDRMKLMDKKKYRNYDNKSRNKKFNQSVRKILSEESLKTLKIVKKKIEEFQPISNLYPSNQRRLLTESLDKDKDENIVALRNKLLGNPYKKLLFGDDFQKQQIGKMNVSNLQKNYTQLSEKYQKERKEATRREEIAQRKRLEEIRKKEQGDKRQAARIARQKKELDLQTRKNQLLEKGKRQTLQDSGEREELRDYYENNRHKIDGENEITSQQLISLYKEEQKLPPFLQQIKQQKRKCKEHSEKVNELQKQIKAKSNRVEQLGNNLVNKSNEVSRINQNIEKDSDAAKQINQKIKKDTQQVSRINQRIKNDSDLADQINQKMKNDSNQINQLKKIIENLSTTREKQQQKRRVFCKNNE